MMYKPRECKQLKGHAVYLSTCRQIPVQSISLFQLTDSCKSIFSSFHLHRFEVKYAEARIADLFFEMRLKRVTVNSEQNNAKFVFKLHLPQLNGVRNF